MKKVIFLVSISILVSCKKDIKQPDPVSEPPKQLSVNGKWQLMSGIIYMENLDTHVKTQYNHFDATKLTSSLRYEGALYPIETLTVNVTTWSIYSPATVPNYGKFALNGDTLNPYGLYVTASNMTVVESPTATVATMQMGGTSMALNITTSDYNNKIADFTVFDSYVTINNQNYEYFSVLKFKKIAEW